MFICLSEYYRNRGKKNFKKISNIYIECLTLKNLWNIRATMMSLNRLSQLSQTTLTHARKFSSVVDQFLARIQTQPKVSSANIEKMKHLFESYRNMDNDKKKETLIHFLPTTLPTIYDGHLIKTPAELAWSNNSSDALPGRPPHHDESAIISELLKTKSLKADMLLEERGAYDGDLSKSLFVYAKLKGITLSGAIISDINKQAIQYGQAFSKYLGLDHFFLHGTGNAISISPHFSGGKCIIANKLLPVMSFEKGREFLENCRRSMAIGDLLVINISEPTGNEFDQKLKEYQENQAIMTIESSGTTFRHSLIPGLESMQEEAKTDTLRHIAKEIPGSTSLKSDDLVQYTTYHSKSEFPRSISKSA